MPGKRWSPAERRRLIRQIQQGKTLPDIRIPGRSSPAINNQRQRLRSAGRLGSQKKRRMQPWTTRELMALRRYVNQFRMSAAQIASAGLLPRHKSKDSISQQMRRQHLGDRRRRLASSLAHRLDRHERAALEQFLRTAGRKVATKEVAAKFGISPKTVTAHRRRLNLRLSWHEARSSEGYRQLMELVRWGIRQKNRARWQRWRADRRLRLEHLQAQMERKHWNHQKRACARCGTVWFATGEFFRVAKRYRGGVVRYTIARTCLACQAEIYPNGTGTAREIGNKSRNARRSSWSQGNFQIPVSPGT